MNRARPIAALLAGLLLAGCPAGHGEPPILGQVPEFHLVADDGRPFDSSSLAGRPWLASFLYTSCPGPCPRLVERLKSVRHDVAADRLSFVSFSVDPQADTPAVLAAYKAKHGIGAADSWTFLTGDPAVVMPLVEKGFLVGVDSGDASSSEGAVSHGTRVALVDGQRRIRGFYATDRDEDLQKLKQDVAALGPGVTP